MFVASDVHVHWLRRFITARMPLPLIVMQCDKMQSAVKRKEGEKRQERRGGYYLIQYMCLGVCVCVCVSSSLVFLRQEITPFGGTALKHYPRDRIHG